MRKETSKVITIEVVPLFVEIVGEPASGKTHLSCLFPKIAILDATPKKESYIIMKKLIPEWKSRYFPIRKFSEAKDTIKVIKNNQDNFKTIVFDTSAALREFAVKDYLDELNKKGKPRESLMPEEYKWVNERIDGLIDEITSSMRINLIFTSQMRDEWVDRKFTGRRIRKGYPDANWQADLRLYLSVDRQVDPNTQQYLETFVRTCRVLKNRFRNQADPSEWISKLTKFSWEGLKELTALKEGELVE